MDGEMDWIAARYLLSTILGVHPLAVPDDDGGREDEDRFPVDGGRGSSSSLTTTSAMVVAVPAAVEAPEGVAAACAVCTEDVVPRQAVVRLPCAHWYHAACIAPWLRITDTCPTCRARLPRETAGGRLRREASYTMLAVIAGALPS